MQRVRGPGWWRVEVLCGERCLQGCVAKRELGLSLNVFVRDLDLPVAQHDGRRLEVVADGLPLFGGAQFAIDTTLVTSVRADGLPSRRCAIEDGAALVQARRRKQRCYPELSGDGRARLVVLAADVGGRSVEARAFVSQLAKAKARSAPHVLAGRVRQAYHALSLLSDLLWGVTATHRLRLSLLVLVATCHLILFPESSVVDKVCTN